MTDRDPFRIPTPFSISFSGGRTSAYMLRRILDAYGGQLPKDSVCLFANTGKEVEQTYTFVREIQDRWKVDIVWVEYRADDPKYAIVDFETASRKGEPFEAIITKRNYLPNAITRFCTVELKIRTMIKHIRSLGWEDWYTAIGIRADEQRRVAKIRARGVSTGTVDETPVIPLADAGIHAEDIGRFWEAQPFNLQLPMHNGRTYHGNCDLCFLKASSQVFSLIREVPERAVWWAAQESRIHSMGRFKGDGARFRNDRASYAEMLNMAQSNGELFSFGDEAIEDCACTD